MCCLCGRGKLDPDLVGTLDRMSGGWTLFSGPPAAQQPDIDIPLFHHLQHTSHAHAAKVGHDSRSVSWRYHWIAFRHGVLIQCLSARGLSAAVVGQPGLFACIGLGGHLHVGQ